MAGVSKRIWRGGQLPQPGQTLKASGVDGPGRLRRDGRGGLRLRNRLSGFLGEREREGDFLGDRRLFLTDADLALEGGERGLQALRLDGKAQDVTRLAHAVAADAFTRGEENGAVI